MVDDQPNDERDLLEAAGSGDLDRVDALLRHGVNADSVNEHGHTPLALASMYGHTRVVSRLIDAGADPNKSDAAGLTILMTAVEFPRAQVVRMLLSSGADVNAIAGDGRTPLLNAIWSAESTPEVVRVLIEAGANLNVTDAKYGLTPREWASKSGKREVEQLLSKVE